MRVAVEGNVVGNMEDAWGVAKDFGLQVLCYVLRVKSQSKMC